MHRAGLIAACSHWHPGSLEGFPTTPTFLYNARKPVRGRAGEHHYYLLAVLRPELAMIYGGDPLKWAGASDLIGGNAWAYPSICISFPELRIPRS